MDSDRLNRWLTLGANIGVLIGLILLLFELDQNLDIVRAQTRNDLATTSIEFLFDQATSPHLAEIIVRSNLGEELSDVETVMYRSRSEAAFRYWENVHYQYRQGMYDEVEFVNHLETMRIIIDLNPGLRRYWCSSERMFSRPFAAEISRFVPDCSLASVQ